MSQGSAEGAALEEEAAHWFARLQAREISNATLEEYRRWRRLPGRREAYAKIEAVWLSTAKLSGDAEIEAKLLEARVRRASSSARPWVWGVASGLGALLIAVAGYSALTRGVISTKVGEQRTLRLTDGSRLILNTDTKVQVAFDNARRVVRLDRGEVLVDVAKEKGRPFEVRAANTTVRALGTRFDVRREGNAVRAVLLEGVIGVEQKEGAVVRRWRLQAGQEISPTHPAPRPISANLKAATSWTEGRIIFEGLPLARAAAEINRYSEEKVVIEDPSAARAPVSGAFDAGDTEAFVTAVSAIYGLRAERAENRILLVKGAS